MARHKRSALGELALLVAIVPLVAVVMLSSVVRLGEAVAGMLALGQIPGLHGTTH